MAVKFLGERLVKRYRRFTLSVDAIEIRPGINVVLGVNGSGKTVLMRLLLGLERPTRGRVWLEYNGERIDTRYAFKYAGYVPARASLPNIRVRDIFRTFGADLGDDPFEVKSLFHKNYVNLSSGEKKRVQLALALGVEKEAYFFDEPFTNIDARFISRLEGIIERLSSEGKTIVIATHLFTRLLRHRLVVLDSGRLVCQCRIPGLLEDAIVVRTSNGIKRLSSMGGVTVERVESPVALVIRYVSSRFEEKR